MDIKKAQERHTESSEVRQDEDKEMVKNFMMKLEVTMELLGVRGLHPF
jgi:hypothetical protein